MDDLFADAIRVGDPQDLVDYVRDDGEADLLESGPDARGLALVSLRVTSGWDRLKSMLGQRNQIYFLSVAFDISDNKPVVLPPKEVPVEAVYTVRPGETITFTLGEGAPIFPPRPITGGLVVYLIVCEADRGIRHVCEVLAKVHEDLAKDDSLIAAIKGFITNLGKSIVDEGLTAFTAALQPIATILKNNGDDYVGLFTGIYPAAGEWEGLTETRNGTTITLRELSR